MAFSKNTQSSMIKTYETLRQQHAATLAQLQSKSNWMVGLRLFSVLGFLALFYGYYKTDWPPLAFFALATLVVFLVLVNRHQKISWKKQLGEALVQNKADEIAYLDGTGLPL